MAALRTSGRRGLDLLWSLGLLSAAPRLAPRLVDESISSRSSQETTLLLPCCSRRAEIRLSGSHPIPPRARRSPKNHRPFPSQSQRTTCSSWSTATPLLHWSLLLPPPLLSYCLLLLATTAAAATTPLGSTVISLDSEKRGAGITADNRIDLVSVTNLLIAIQNTQLHPAPGSP